LRQLPTCFAAEMWRMAAKAMVICFCSMSFFVTASTQSVSCFSLKPLHSTLFWPPCAFQWSLTSPLDWIEATLDLLCTEMWQMVWHHLNLSHGMEQSIASAAPFVPIQDSIHPSLLAMVEPPVPLNWKKTASWMIFL
jgi:hypothetical protein